MIDHGFRVMLGHNRDKYPVIPVGFQRRDAEGRTETDLLYRFADGVGMKADDRDTTVRLSRDGHWMRLPENERHARRI